MYQEADDQVLRLTDGAFIPKDPRNNDYAEYLRWLAAGNQTIVLKGRIEDVCKDLRWDLVQESIKAEQVEAAAELVAFTAQLEMNT